MGGLWPAGCGPIGIYLRHQIGTPITAIHKTSTPRGQRHTPFHRLPLRDFPQMLPANGVERLTARIKAKRETRDTGEQTCVLPVVVFDCSHVSLSCGFWAKEMAVLKKGIALGQARASGTGFASTGQLMPTKHSKLWPLAPPSEPRQPRRFRPTKTPN